MADEWGNEGITVTDNKSCPRLTQRLPVNQNGQEQIKYPDVQRIKGLLVSLVVTWATWH